MYYVQISNSAERDLISIQGQVEDYLLVIGYFNFLEDCRSRGPVCQSELH